MKKTTKIILSGLCVAAIGGTTAMAACSPENSGITITGSSSVSPLMSALAEEYMKDHDVNIVIQTSDSGTGVSDAINGTNSFGMASRDLRNTETGVTGVTLCMDGVALVVNNANTTVTSVTGNEVYQLYSAGTAIQDSITNAITRENGSGTRDAFDGLIADTDGKKLSSITAFANVVSQQSSTGGVKQTIVSNSAGNTVGYISLGSLDNTVKAVQFEGVNASIENIQNGTYSLSRPFNIAYNTANGLDEASKAFLQFVFSTAGQEIIADEGYVPLSAAQLAEQVAKLG